MKSSSPQSVSFFFFKIKLSGPTTVFENLRLKSSSQLTTSHALSITLSHSPPWKKVRALPPHRSQTPTTTTTSRPTTTSTLPLASHCTSSAPSSPSSRSTTPTSSAPANALPFWPSVSRLHRKPSGPSSAALTSPRPTSASSRAVPSKTPSTWSLASYATGIRPPRSR